MQNLLARREIVEEHRVQSAAQSHTTAMAKIICAPERNKLFRNKKTLNVFQNVMLPPKQWQKSGSAQAQKTHPNISAKINVVTPALFYSLGDKHLYT